MSSATRRLILAATAVGLFWSVPAAAAEAVYLIRHLQKAAGDDPPLTPQGTAGASKLADMLSDRGINAVFATPTRRAIQTATPLAVRLGLPVKRYDPANASALVEAVRETAGNVLIVGHSNTVPDLVAQFGAERPADMTEQDYGQIYVVNIGTKEVREINLPAAPVAN